jgi:hypothetical protein
MPFWLLMVLSDMLVAVELPVVVRHRAASRTFGPL